VLTRWVAAAIAFALIWLLAITAAVVAWSWRSAPGLLRGRAPGLSGLMSSVAATTLESRRWLRKASGWDE
jgi:hypothetical protein